MKLQLYLQEGIHSIDGWLQKIAIHCLLHIQTIQLANNIYGQIVEIGVYQGKLFIVLYLLRRKEELCIAVDVFEEQEKNKDIFKYSVTENDFKGNGLRHAGEIDSMKILRGRSEELSPNSLLETLGAKVRIFSIDGGHSKETTCHDMALADACLADGGVIVVDDVFNPEHPGVSEGVNTFVTSDVPTLSPFLLAGNKVFFCQTRYHDLYFLSFKNTMQSLFNGTKGDAFISRYFAHDVVVLSNLPIEQPPITFRDFLKHNRKVQWLRQQPICRELIHCLRKVLKNYV